MSRHVLSARVTIAALLGLLITAGDVATAAASLTATACCAKSRGDCAGVKAPDDCCRGMGHVSAGPARTAPPSGPTLDSPFQHSALPQTTAAHSGITSSATFISIAFKRPHDPPHLHTFALLI